MGFRVFDTLVNGALFVRKSQANAVRVVGSIDCSSSDTGEVAASISIFVRLVTWSVSRAGGARVSGCVPNGITALGAHLLGFRLGFEFLIILLTFRGVTSECLCPVGEIVNYVLQSFLSF